ncbi:MAG: VCBS repeat-containing protein [Saprospiraceae bacterium]|nr:VCBS repeat-containing protein [Saprospiraceae bacterium]
MMPKITYLVTSLLLISILSCDKWNTEKTGPGMNNLPLKSAQVKGLFEYLDSNTSGLNFVNNMPDSMAIYVFMNEYAFNGGGVAIGDINNDGLSDVYFSSTFESNRLYLNLGNMKFKDITQETGVNGGAGWKTGVTMVDINDDGLLDIYVCKSGQFRDPAYRANALYINKGNLKFEEAGAKYGLQDISYSTQSYFADFDADGDLDMYLVNHPLGWPKKHALDASQDASGNIIPIEDTFRVNVSDRLYINNDGRYVDRTKAYGVDNIAFGLSAAIFDANGDGYPDIYVANDYAAPDYLYINQGGKRFKKETDKYFHNIPNNSMGSDMLDANNDGRLDLFVNDMMPEKKTNG